MLSLFFYREAAILGHKIAFWAVGEPPQHIWPAMRREGWTIEADLVPDPEGRGHQHFLRRVFDPQGNYVFGAGKSDDNQGYSHPDKNVRRNYARTVKRLIRKHTLNRPGNPHP